MIIGALSVVMVNAQLDTTGLWSWQPMYNSMTSWEEGAFSMYATGHPDYGWGVYNSQNHNIDGDSLFIIKGIDGKYRDLYIEMKYSVQDYYIFRYTDIDGGGEIFEKAPCYDYTGKLYLYYSFETGEFIDREPPKAEWDFVLTKMHDNLQNYTVTAFLLNEKVKACLFDAADSATAYNAALADTTVFTDSLTIIGSSWYELSGYSILPLKDRAYFIKDLNNNIFRMNVTYFESGMSGDGRVGVRLQKLFPEPGEVVEDTLTMGPAYANDVYYGLSSGTATLAARDNWDIAFKTDAFSSSIITNAPMGFELYSYPKADETAWATYGTGNEVPNNLSLLAYPNPVRDVVNLRTEKFRAGDLLTITVTDISGRVVLRSKATASDVTVLNLDRLETGSYFITATSGRMTGTTRIIKTR